jgi:hypothetical protein
MPTIPTHDGSAFTSLQTVLAGLSMGDANKRLQGTKHSGPVGIESIIEYRCPVPLYLNVVDWIDTWIVITINGLDGPDLRASAFPNPGEHGETPGDPLFGGRTVGLIGKVYASTIWKMRDMQMGLRASLYYDIKTEYPLIFHAVDPADDLMVNCKIAQAPQIPDQQTVKNEHVRDFQIMLRASNPRFLSVVRERFALENQPAGSSYDKIAAVLYNKGNFEAHTTVELVGPMTNPRITNETNSTSTVLKTGTTIPAGETWVLENTGTSKRFYRKSDGANRFSYLDDTSMWLMLAANNVANNIRFTASGLATGWALNVIYRHTFM